MKQAGRDSAAALAMVAPLPSRMLQPPKALTVEQSKVWGSVVATKPADWFQADFAAGLVAYCRDVVEADRVSAAIDKFDPEWLNDDEGLKRYEKLLKMRDKLHMRIKDLATAMRLTQQARLRADAAGVADKRAQGKRPWQVIENDD